MLGIFDKMWKNCTRRVPNYCFVLDMQLMVTRLDESIRQVRFIGDASVDLQIAQVTGRACIGAQHDDQGHKIGSRLSIKHNGDRRSV